MRTLIFFTLLMSTPLVARPEPPPAGALDLDETINLFRNPLQRKIQDLSDNYILRQSASSLTYSSSKDMSCSYRFFAAHTALVRILSSHQSGPDFLRETIVYDDCFSPRSLTEEVNTRGTDLKPLSLRELSRGVRSFKLEKNEQERFYKINNADGESVASVLVKRDPLSETNWHAQFQITAQTVLNMYYQEEFKNNRRSKRWMWSFPTALIRYARPWAPPWRNGYGMVPSLQILAETDTQGSEQIRYIHNGSSISQSMFQQIFQEHVTDKQARLSILKDIMNYHLYSFPSTELVSSVGVNQRLQNELRLANIRLLGNSEINLVQQFIQSILIAIEKGDIVVNDRRPQ